jgi:trk system potassium uptake protein TrkA
MRSWRKWNPLEEGVEAMRLIVLGCGRAGSYLANYLAEKEHEITVIDRDPKAFRVLRKELHIRAVQGPGTDIDILKEAGIERANALAAVMDDDDANLMACLIAKRLYQVPKVVAGLRNPRMEKISHEFGLEAVCPLTIGVHRIIDALVKER